MMFDKNIKEFSTMVHRDIYMTALRIKPPEITLIEIEKFDPELAESGREFHAFMTELLSDMYNHPNLYGMNPGVYEKFVDGRKFFAVKRNQPTKALTFYKQSGEELASYLQLIKVIAIHCKIENGKCFLLAEDYDKIEKQKRLIPLAAVTKILERTGLQLHLNSDSSVTVTNAKHPNMLRAMSELAKTADNSVKNPVSKSAKYYYAINYDFLEFRQIFKNYWPDYDDVTRYLSDDNYKIVEKLREIARENNMSEAYSYYGGSAILSYQYKSKPMMSIWLDGLWIEPHLEQKQWIRKMHVRIFGSPRLEYQQNIEKYGEDFVKYFRRHLNYCGCCNPDHVKNPGGIRQVLGKNVRICSDPRGDISNPTTKDLPYIQKYIDLRKEEILAGVR